MIGVLKSKDILFRDNYVYFYYGFYELCILFDNKFIDNYVF